MATMLGWFRLAAACASRRKRSTNDGSRANSGKRALRATWRFSDSSVARYTSAIPPRAISRSIRYRFEKTWPTRDIVAKPYLSIVRISGPSHGATSTGPPSPVHFRRHDPGRRICAWLGPLGTRISLRTEQGAQHLRRDRSGDAAAGRFGLGRTAVLDEHRDRVERVVGGRERDEPRVRRLVRRVLRGARLAGNLDARDLRGRSGAALDDLDHPLVQRRGGRGVHGPAPYLGLDPAHDVPVGVLDAVGDVRLEHHAVGRDRLGDGRQLERRHRDGALADRRLREPGLLDLERARARPDARDDRRIEIGG